MASASTIALDLIGSLSLVETLLEFIYVIRSRSKFTPFERLFFMAAGISEMAGEVLLLIIMVAWLHQKRISGIRKKDPLSRAAAQDHLGRLSKDPIHVLRDLTTAYLSDAHKINICADDRAARAAVGAATIRDDSYEVEGDKDLRRDVENMVTAMNGVDAAGENVRVGITIVLLSLLCTLSPTLFMGVVLVSIDLRSPGDERIMLALTVVSFAALIAVLTVALYYFRGPTAFLVKHYDLRRALVRLSTILVAVVYSVEKVFEVFLLLSRSERLAADTLSQSLIVFQLIELTSVANIIFVCSIDFFFGVDHPESTRLQRVERAVFRMERVLKLLDGKQDAFMKRYLEDRPEEEKSS